MGGWVRTASVRPQFFRSPQQSVEPVRRDSVGKQRAALPACKPTRARPLPIGRRPCQTATNRIHMDVFNVRQQRGRRIEISVVASSALPKQTLDLLTAAARDSRKPGWLVFFQESDGPLGNRTFDRLSNSGDVVLFPRGKNQQVRVIGHKDVRPELELELFSRGINCACQPAACSVSSQKMVAVVTGKRQCVSVTTLIEGSPMQASWSHCVRLRRRAR